MRSREWHLLRRPQGWPTRADFALVDRELPPVQAGEVVVRNLYLSVDPYMRGRMNAARSYAPPYELGQVMYGEAVGRVAESADDRLPVGAWVRTRRAWREAFVCPAGEPELIDVELAPPASYLGVLGMPGMTAWVGVHDIGEVRPGETVFVSAASGAVGSLAGQLARLVGCRVIGSAGSAEKVRYLTEDLGYDAAFDYHAGDIIGQLQAAAPEGVDVYFDNVGGEHLRAALACLNVRGRVAACGSISSYNEPQPGPDNLAVVVGKRIRIQGFIVWDHADRLPLFTRYVGGLLQTGQVRYRETVVDGIEQAVQAFLDLLRGGTHLGKLVVRVSSPDD
jgi:NADPH-dependent curcumin reductase CurA